MRVAASSFVFDAVFRLVLFVARGGLQGAPFPLLVGQERTYGRKGDELSGAVVKFA